MTQLADQAGAGAAGLGRFPAPPTLAQFPPRMAPLMPAVPWLYGRESGPSSSPSKTAPTDEGVEEAWLFRAHQSPWGRGREPAPQGDNAPCSLCLCDASSRCHRHVREPAQPLKLAVRHVRGPTLYLHSSGQSKRTTVDRLNRPWRGVFVRRSTFCACFSLGSLLWPCLHLLTHLQIAQHGQRPGQDFHFRGLWSQVAQAHSMRESNTTGFQLPSPRFSY